MRILCPTDLSDHSLLALDYAIDMHNALGGELHIITTYQIKRNAGSMINIDDKVQKNTEEDLKQVVDRYADRIKTGNDVQQAVIPGDAADVITAYARRHDMHYIIMGTQGSNSLRTLLFGSVTRKVSQVSDVPVIAVPNEAKESHYGGSLLLAVDDKVNEDVEFLDPLIKLSAATKQDIDIVHVDKEQDGLNNPTILERLSNHLGTVTIVEEKDPIAALKKVAEKRKVSLLVMIRREKSFMQRLLLKGHTAAEVGQIHVPVMILSEAG